MPSLDLQYVYFRSSATSDGVFRDTGIDGLFDAQRARAAGDPPGSAPDLNQDDFGPSAAPRATASTRRASCWRSRAARALTPRLAAPFRLGNFAELYPEVGWSQALYDSDATGFEQRGLATARVELRTRLRRRFGDA